MSHRLILAVILLTSGSLPIAAQESTRNKALVTYRDARGYVCYRADRPLDMDGKLDEAAWKNAPWTEEFLDIQGTSQPAPRFRTRAKMLWDDEFFYIAAEMEEPHVWGTLTEHDSVIFHDNDFEVFIDPDGDLHQYYEFEMNALNTGWDLRLVKPYRDGGPALNEWEIPGLRTGVHVRGTLNDSSDEDEGWTVEIALPWKALAEFANRPAPPRDGDAWRVNFSRVEWKHRIVDGRYEKVPNTPEDNWVWSPQGVIDMHRPEHWGYVQFSTAPPGTATFRPDPAAPIRDALMAVYHAQKAHQAESGAWTDSLDKLGIDPSILSYKPALRATSEGFEAAIVEKPADDTPSRVWKIREDSRIWSEPAASGSARP